METLENLQDSAVRAQIERMRRSAAFTGSERLLTFLAFLVEETLDGRQAQLREATIGNAIYRRDPPYDPRIDSTVRVEARRLRKKLSAYFDTEGRSDHVMITVPVGGYTPRFAQNTLRHMEVLPAEIKEEQSIFQKGQGAAMAILPFKPLSRSAEIVSFAEGLTDELLHKFSAEPGLRILSHATSAVSVDRYQPVSSIAVELGVDVVLQGSVKEHNGVVRVSVEASNATGFVTSSDRFDGPLSNLPLLMENIATTILSRRRIDSSAMRAHKTGPRTKAVESHGKVYRARRLMDKQTTRALRDALAMFEDLIVTAPDYARGYAGIADCCCDLYRIGTITHGDALARARPAAERACEIDAASADARTAMATVFTWLERDRLKGEREFKAAIEIGRSSRSFRVYGTFLTLLGRHEEAEQVLARARQIEPISHQQDILESVSRFQSRNFSKAVLPSMCDPEDLPLEVVFNVSLSKLFDGDTDGARQLAATVPKGSNVSPLMTFALEEINARLGQPEGALKVLAASYRGASDFAMATLASSLRDESQTLAHLSQAVTAKELSTVWMRSDPRFDWLRPTAEFASLIEQLESQRAS